MSKKMITNRLVEDCPTLWPWKEHFRRTSSLSDVRFPCMGRETNWNSGSIVEPGTALMNWYRSSIGSPMRQSSSQSSRMVEATAMLGDWKESGIPTPSSLSATYCVTN